MTRFSIYLPPDLNTWVEERAKAEGRSKAKQVAHILKLYRDIIDGHASVLARPGYSLEDERWSSLKANKLPKIGDVPARCECGWKGAVDDCLPDVDSQGNLGCPECEQVINIVVGEARGK